MTSTLFGQGLLWLSAILLVLSWVAALLARTERWRRPAATSARLLKRASLLALALFAVWLVVFVIGFIRAVTG